MTVHDSGEILNRINSHHLERRSAILWDLDGTLINSEPLHVKAVGKTVSWLSEEELQEMVIGKPDQVIYYQIQKKYPLQFNVTLDFFLAHKEQELKKLLNADEFIENIFPVLNDLKVRFPNCKHGVVTASEKDSALSFLHHCFECRGFLFDCIVTNETTILKKPHPAPYLFAMKQLGGLTPDQVLIVEDSPTGRAAGYATGAPVVYANWFS